MKRLLLTLALCMSLFAGGFLLTIQNGSICYREPGGAWHDTGCARAAPCPHRMFRFFRVGCIFPAGRL